MPSVLGIAGDPLALQLALAGVSVEQVGSAAEAEQRLRAAMDDEGVPLVIVEERFRAAFSPAMTDRLAQAAGAPLVVFCPSFEHGAVEADDPVAGLLKSALGHAISLE